MFIIVKYGQNETLLCNPMCAIINLLNSIKKRAGYGNSNVIVDLSDETGLVKELDLHKYDSATKYLNSHETYILVQKEQLQDNLSIDSGSPIDSKNYQYTPLLEQYENLFPNFKVHVDHIATPKIKKRGGKSPSPAGRFTSKPKKTTESGTSKKTSAKKK
ncbi:uncharacterized protein CXorf65 homolog [Mytilus galloprovincialis]|uniref:Uncharacterized protein n=2 Tax=Mytilus TaxID=6548 RepID=A0A8B6E705_MYTGA|nr:unnamed protein product [Mytilus edulis]VDI30025.1 Hypothetical predicted protein [Mytilus galloprovincialis]